MVVVVSEAQKPLTFTFTLYRPEFHSHSKQSKWRMTGRQERSYYCVHQWQTDY